VVVNSLGMGQAVVCDREWGVVCDGEGSGTESWGNSVVCDSERSSSDGNWSSDDGLSDSWGLSVNDGVESVDGVSSVGNGTDSTIGLDERVLSLDGITISGFGSSLGISGKGI